MYDAYILCKIIKKSGLGPKIGNKYRSPLKVEEFRNDDWVALLLIVDDEALKEVSAATVVAGGYVEVVDLY